MNQNDMFPDEAPKGMSEKAKKILFLSLGGVLLLVFVIVLIAGPKKRESAPEEEQVAAVEKLEEYEKVMASEPKQVTMVASSEDEIGAALRKSSELPENQGGESDMTYPAVAEERPEPSRARTAAPKPRESSSGGGFSMEEEIPYKYKASRRVQKRIDQDYQKMVRHWKGTKEEAWQISGDQYKELKKGNAIARVEEPLRELYDGAATIAHQSKYTIPAASRILAVTDHPVSSDHPGWFTSRIVRPHVLRGAKLLCESAGNVNDRIPVKPVKIIMPDNGKEIELKGQVEMQHPGLGGRVRNHWPGRVVPALVNAGIGGAFAAWTLNNEVDSIRIDTRDQITGPIIQESVGQLQSEISRLGSDRPNTVSVKRGTQFAVLLTESITVAL